MSFGLKNAPQIYQRRMDEIYKPYENFIIFYVDNILVFSKTIKEHIKHLQIFKKQTNKNRIVLSERKAIFLKKKIEFLGLIIDEDGVKLQKHIGRKILNVLEKLTNKKEIQYILGRLNFGKEFINELSKKRASLQKIIK